MTRMLSNDKQYAAEKIRPQPQGEGGRLYKRADFNVEAVRQMWRNLDAGMIESYLAEPNRADSYPIIE